MTATRGEAERRRQILAGRPRPKPDHRAELRRAGRSSSSLVPASGPITAPPRHLAAAPVSARAEGAGLHGLVRELYPHCRSLTGEGLRATLDRIGREIPLERRAVPSGTPVLDWEIPPEWTIRSAWIETLDGERLIDFAWSNLHVVGYSGPVDAVIPRETLARHVHTLPDAPDLIPYRTAYYAGAWGFCLPHRLWETMRDEAYRVRIDAALAPGQLDYGEVLIPGESADEILICAHCCHPSLANDNLSGIAIAATLARRRLAGPRRRLSLRVLFAPATIGAIAWLAANEAALPRIVGGLVLSCLGDPGSFHYKLSRRGNATVDRAAALALKRRGAADAILPFTPIGYDERQFCSPGYDLPVGCLMRTPNGVFPEYHTSADNPDFVTAEALGESLEAVEEIIAALDAERVYQRVDGRGEPQLGRRGLYAALGGAGAGDATQTALLWVLNLADGRSSLIDMAERSGVDVAVLADAARIAADHGLIKVQSD